MISETWAGRHEVVIESPRHDADLSTTDTEAVRNVLHAYRVRERALKAEGWAYVVIFRNRGSRAGASLGHPHSQIVAAPLVPSDVRHRLEIATTHLHETGGSLCRDVLNRELQDGRRVVLEQDQFIVFHPFASAAPFETWIMPRVQRSASGELGDDDLGGFAIVLRAVLAGLKQVLGNFPYNFVIESFPARTDDSSDHISWYLRLVPRLTVRAGFELASGIDVNPVSPEDSAARLRSIVVRRLLDR